LLFTTTASFPFRLAHFSTETYRGFLLELPLADEAALSINIFQSSCVLLQRGLFSFIHRQQLHPSLILKIQAAAPQRVVTAKGKN